MAVFDPAAPWRQSLSVGLRPEPFGALAYHFETRRLVFLKTPLLVEIVESLAAHPTLDAALEATELDDAGRARHRRALESLAESGVIEPRPPQTAEAPTP